MSPLTKPGKTFRLPHTLVLILILLLGVYVLSLVIPSGEFQRVKKSFQGVERQVTLPGTYRAIEKRHLGPEWLVIAPVRGFADGVLIISLVFIFGGVFGILQKTGAIEAGIQRLSAFFAGRRKLKRLVIPALMIVFSLAGSTYGMSEESIPFVLIFIPLAISLGYDSIVGVAIPFLGAAAGFAAACFNPFTVGIAQGFSDLPLYSGLGYRLVLWFLGTAIIVAFVMIYAEKVRKKPELSPVHELDRNRRLDTAAASSAPPWGRPQKRVLLILAAGMAWMVYGILVKKWYMEEIAALFLAMGILSGFAGKIKPSLMAESFVAGARDMMNVAFIIACGRAVLIVLQQALVLDTILYYSAALIASVPRLLTAQIMFLTQSVINFFIHSGTAQAALTMPVMAPLSDLIGISRQTTVLSFQLCEFINPILPTSAVTMGVLGVARIPYEKWAKWFLPLMLILMVFSLLALVPPVLMHWGPF
ncbi:MAG TPA: hypothetical protein VMZ49_11895 [Patescibacteria group bacterium]|nr:hypothetical protein [Patescibacteria group bacterium]